MVPLSLFSLLFGTAASGYPMTYDPDPLLVLAGALFACDRFFGEPTTDYFTEFLIGLRYAAL